jgi:hypothetical protein
LRCKLTRVRSSVCCCSNRSLCTAWEGTDPECHSTFLTIESAEASSADALFAKESVPQSSRTAIPAAAALQRTLTPKLLLESLAAHKHKSGNSRPATAVPSSHKRSFSSSSSKHSVVRKHSAVCKLPAVTPVRHASVWDDSPLFGARCPVAHPELLAQQHQQHPLQQQQQRHRSLSPPSTRRRAYTATCSSTTVQSSVHDRRCVPQANGHRAIHSAGTNLRSQHIVWQPSNSMVTSSSTGRLRSAPMQLQQQQHSVRAASAQHSVRTSDAYSAVAACYSAAVASNRKTAAVKALLRKALPWQAQLCPRALEDFELARTAVFYRQLMEAAAAFTHARSASVKALLHGEDAWCTDVATADWRAVEVYKIGLKSTADTVKEHVGTASATRLTAEVRCIICWIA